MDRGRWLASWGAGAGGRAPQEPGANNDNRGGDGPGNVTRYERVVHESGGISAARDPFVYQTTPKCDFHILGSGDGICALPRWASAGVFGSEG